MIAKMVSKSTDRMIANIRNITCKYKKLELTKQERLRIMGFRYEKYILREEQGYG